MTTPARIPITRPVLGEEEVLAAAEVIRSGWLAMGARVAELERGVAELVGTEHAVAVSSGTAALHLALLALNLGPGDEVVVPSLSFIATASAVLYTGATPVLADVDPRTFNLTPEAAEAALTPRTRALMPVHQLGLPAELDALRELATRHRLSLVEDAACALGASYRGRPVGGQGRLGCFSFHPRKLITTGEGGVITTDDGELAARLRRLRAQGVSLAADARHGAARLVFEEYPEVGYNYRLTDLQAAIGVEQLRRLPALIAARRARAARYSAALAKLPGVVPPYEPAGYVHTFQSYQVLLEGSWCRREVMQHLLERGVDSRRAVMAIHRSAAYRERCAGLSLPVSERVARRGLILPLYPQLTDEEQDRVVAALAEVCR